MISGCRVRIAEFASGRHVDGLLRPAGLSDKVLWTHWHGKMPPGAEDAHWEWDALIDLAAAMPDRFEVYALEAAEDLQGLGMLEVSENDVDEYGVHLLRLSTAPWNRPPRAPLSRCGKPACRRRDIAEYRTAAWRLYALRISAWR
jgi:hypothetical protein